MEEKIGEIMDDLESHGGMVEAIESGYVQGLIAEQAFRYEQAVVDGSRTIVGVNRFKSDDSVPDVVGYELDDAGRDRQLQRLAEVKRSRDDRAVAAVLLEIEDAARGDTNLMPLLIQAVKEYVTIGEIVTTLKGVWGEFVEPTVF